ncbi:MAG: LON peptidase substrate-binding domain-containing protein [Propionibacteriaceae bacterium]
MPVLPMFPLGSVLFPSMPLGLRVFEPRYLQLMADVLDSGEPRFGVVLIERGFEVGGGDGRFQHGTVASIVEIKEQQDMLAVAARGDRRLVVREWLPDDPYPRADVELLEPLVWTDELADLRMTCEAKVRRCLAIASEFSEATWPADVELSDDPVDGSWQLAAIAPLAAMDQMALLQSGSLKAMLTRLIRETDDALELIELQIAVQPDDDAPS